MIQATTGSTRPPHPNRRQEDFSVLHFKRFLEAFSAPVSTASVIGMQRSAKFRVLHVKRTLVAQAAALAPVGASTRAIR